MEEVCSGRDRPKGFFRRESGTPPRKGAEERKAKMWAGVEYWRALKMESLNLREEREWRGEGSAALWKEIRAAGQEMKISLAHGSWILDEWGEGKARKECVARVL